MQETCPRRKLKFPAEMPNGGGGAASRGGLSARSPSSLSPTARRPVPRRSHVARWAARSGGRRLSRSPAPRAAGGVGCSGARPPLDGTFSPTQGGAGRRSPGAGRPGAPSRARAGRCAVPGR